MSTEPGNPKCLNCDRSDTEAVLVSIRSHGSARWICSTCFPLLIHNPEKLAGRLEGAEGLTASSHEHD
jgi:hypothetical protein